MSGGAAKGLAHIGVLKALEEHDIPVDYVVGTSMGGIVGAFYAAGYAPEEIDNLVTKPYFQQWLKGVLSEKYDYFFSKRDLDPSFITLNLAIDSAFSTSLNTNLASDLAINFVFAEMLAQASQAANYNFDNLMVPFRCMAADVFTQKEEILKGGFLNEAARTTMTVPFFYRPIQLNKKYLFDGGIYNNFPVDVAQNEFNPEVVIGVNVSTTKFEEYPYQEDYKILSESFAFLFLDKSDPSKVNDNGIYIQPDLGNNSSLDFQNARAIIDSGYVKTITQIEEIKNKIKRRTSKQEITAKRANFVNKFKPFEFESIRLKGFKPNQRRYVRNLFHRNKGKLGLEDIKLGYFKLVSESYFKDIFPNIIYNEASGKFDFEILAKQSQNFKVDFGGAIASRSISQIYLGFQYNFLKSFLHSYSLNFYTGRFYQSIKAKPRFNFPSQKLFYIEPEFTINTWDFIDAQDLVFGEDPRAILNQTDRKYGLNIGIAAGNRGKLLIQGAYISNTDKFSNNQELISSDTLDILNLNGSRFAVSFERNTLNRKQYADHGDLLNLSINYFNLEENYDPGNTSLIEGFTGRKREWFRFNFTAEKYFKLGAFNLGIYLESVLSNQPFFGNYTATVVNAPAFFPLQDSKSIFLRNFRAFNYGVGGIKNVININRLIDLRIEAYAYKPIREIVETETQSATLEEELTKFYFTGAVTGVYHSPLGPIGLSLNYYDDAQKKFGALLHLGYLIYNKRSME